MEKANMVNTEEKPQEEKTLDERLYPNLAQLGKK